MITYILNWFHWFLPAFLEAMNILDIYGRQEAILGEPLIVTQNFLAHNLGRP